MTLLWYISVLFVLISPSVRGQANEECDGAFDIFAGQGVDSTHGARAEIIRNITDRAACVSACCRKKDCHLAIVGTPQDDGPAQCFLVNCMKDGKDVCRMQKQMDFTAFKKKSTSIEGRTVDSTDNCTAPMAVGKCRAAFPRFYYNGTSCQEFVYGGCGGNGNNFETIEACNAACSGTSGAGNTASAARSRMGPIDIDAGSPRVSPREVTAEDFAVRCQATAMTGPCRAALPRYFYNSTAAACQQFIYGGCKGNENNYLSEEECQANCSVSVIPSARKATGKTSAPPADCTAKFETGPCRAALPRFYYDPSTMSCLPFIYGGCQGNGNRFSSVAECLSRCSGQEGALEKRGTLSSRTPAYVTVGTLVIFSALALAGLLLVMLRKSKFPRRHRDDKQELLPEDQLAAEVTA